MASRISQIHDKGEFRIFYQYVNGEPGMVIASSFMGRRRAWVIGLSSAWKYADSETGAPTAYLIEAAGKIGDLLGLGADRMTAFRIASAIVDHLPDLLTMPPEMPTDWRKQAERDELVVKLNGETLVDAR